MSQGLVTTAPTRVRHRTVIAVALFVVLAVGVGAAVLTLTSSEPVPTAEPAAPAAVTIPAPVRLCGNDGVNLLAAIATMTPFIQADVVGRLSPPIADWLGHLALLVDATTGLPAPDATTLG